MSKKNAKKKNTGKFVLGAAIGAAIGLLFAPKSGKEMRKELGFLENVTFGIEIEAEHSKKSKITNEIDDSYCDWNVKGDGSLTNGIEVNSPILEDSIESWRDVEGICNIISNNAKVDKNTGGHIHIGAHILGDKPECWLNFLRLWSTYENVIYRFSYGEFLVARPAIKRYAKPASKLSLIHI